MPNIRFEVLCKYCGAGLCDNVEVKQNETRGVTEIHVVPCSNCVEEAREAGKKQGYEEGIIEGEEYGFTQGEAAAKAEAAEEIKSFDDYREETI